jgi:hypothetical protein
LRLRHGHRAQQSQTAGEFNEACFHGFTVV